MSKTGTRPSPPRCKIDISHHGSARTENMAAGWKGFVYYRRHGMVSHRFRSPDFNHLPAKCTGSLWTVWRQKGTISFPLLPGSQGSGKTGLVHYGATVLRGTSVSDSECRRKACG